MGAHSVRLRGTAKLTVLRMQPDILSKRVAVLKAGQTASWAGTQHAGGPSPARSNRRNAFRVTVHEFHPASLVLTAHARGLEMRSRAAGLRTAGHNCNPR